MFGSAIVALATVARATIISVFFDNVNRINSF